MIHPKQLFRLLHINNILVKHGLDDLILTTHLFRPISFIRHLLPWNWVIRHKSPRAVRIRKSLEDLGPIFIKFGQILSTRRDLLPNDIADELAKLQDNVPPFSSKTSVAIIRKSLGKEIDDIFSSFDLTPLASASIAQVHSATLHNGDEVIVKVVRPHIEKMIKRDLSLLYTLARLAQRYWQDGRRLRPVEVVEEYEKTILDELDLMKEAANASQLRRNFKDSPLLYVPEVNWDLTRRNVMVMEKIHGAPISDINVLSEKGVDLEKLSERGVEIFFTQVFRDSFFHADMHPGNIFVADNGQYIAVDFGIMGTLNHDDQRYLAENFLAFFNRDYRKVAELHIESEWVPGSTQVEEFESAIRSVCEPIFERPLKDISFGRLLLRLFQTARRFNMEVQPQLVLLQKTLLNIEGLGRQLNPELDLWKTAKPFLEKWMSEQIGPKAFLYSLKKQVPDWAEKVPAIPGLLHSVLTQAKTGNLTLQWKSKELEDIKKEIKRANQRTYAAIIGSSLIISAAIISGLDGYSPTMLGSLPLATWALGTLGCLILAYALPSNRP